MKLFRITCDEATMICDKSQYGESTFFERLKLQIHFLGCKICRRYTKQNNLLTRVYKNEASRCKSEEQKCMNHEDKEKLKKELEKFSL